MKESSTYQMILQEGREEGIMLGKEEGREEGEQKGVPKKRGVCCCSSEASGSACRTKLRRPHWMLSYHRSRSNNGPHACLKWNRGRIAAIVFRRGETSAMHKILARPTFGQVTALLSIATGALVAARYVETRKINGAERLADALLHTNKLRDAAEKLPDASAQAVALCAAFFVMLHIRRRKGLARQAKRKTPPDTADTFAPIYQCCCDRTDGSGRPGAAAHLRGDDSRVGEVPGTRRVGAMRISGLAPARPTPDTAQITLKDGYTAQIETEFEVADYLLLGKTRMSGKARLRDDRGNVALLTIGYDGLIFGTVNPRCACHRATRRQSGARPAI